jgi:hypothetical protein
MVYSLDTCHKNLNLQVSTYLNLKSIFFVLILKIKPYLKNINPNPKHLKFNLKTLKTKHSNPHKTYSNTKP